MKTNMQPAGQRGVQLDVTLGNLKAVPVTWNNHLEAIEACKAITESGRFPDRFFKVMPDPDRRFGWIICHQERYDPASPRVRMINGEYKICRRSIRWEGVVIRFEERESRAPERPISHDEAIQFAKQLEQRWGARIR